MLPKLILIVITIGATACSVLVIRQQRIDLAHDMANIHRRINAEEQRLWQLRVEIHNHLSSETVRQMVTAFEAHHGMRFTAVKFGDRLEAVLIPTPGLTPIREIADGYVVDTDRHGPLRVRQERFGMNANHHRARGHTFRTSDNSEYSRRSDGTGSQRGPSNKGDHISTPPMPGHGETESQDFDEVLPSEA